jgi:integrase
MASKPLTALDTDRISKPGLHFDSRGLYLQVSGAGSKCWILRYTLKGKARWLGLGSARDVSLKQARERRDVERGKLAKGIDPVEARQAERAAERAIRNPPEVTTFKMAAEKYLHDHDHDWSNAMHRRQWRSTLKAYAYPMIRDLPVSAITAAHIVEILRPIWRDKNATARRVRGRIEAVLDYAADPDDHGFRNPATLTARLKKALPKPQSKPEHLAALPYAEIAALMGKLRRRDGAAARALEFVILTAARTCEALGATWPEVDHAAKVWTIPAARMKARKSHRVPLSDPAIAVLEQMRAIEESDIIFPGIKAGRALSNAAMLAVLGRLGHSNLTVHGFRSTFRDWAGDRARLEGAREAAEAALAHVVKDKSERAYARSDLFEKRRVLMSMWSVFCDTLPETNVLPMARPVPG